MKTSIPLLAGAFVAGVLGGLIGARLTTRPTGAPVRANRQIVPSTTNERDFAQLRSELDLLATEVRRLKQLSSVAGQTQGSKSAPVIPETAPDPTRMPEDKAQQRRRSLEMDQIKERIARLETAVVGEVRTKERRILQMQLETQRYRLAQLKDRK